MGNDGIHESFVKWDSQQEGDAWGEFYAGLYNRYSIYVYPDELTNLAIRCYEEITGLRTMQYIVYGWDALTKIHEQGVFIRAFTLAFKHVQELKT